MGLWSWLRGPRVDEVQTAPTGPPERCAQVQDVLAELRPMLRADGGDVQLIGIDEGTVSLRLRGACHSCAVSTLTLQGAIVPRLRAACDWFEGVQLVD